MLPNALVSSFSTFLTLETTQAVAVRWEASWSAVCGWVGHAAGLGKQGTASCCSFDGDKAGELCPPPALMSRGEQRKHCWVLIMMHERLGFVRGWCLQILSSREGLLGDTLPV